MFNCRCNVIFLKLGLGFTADVTESTPSKNSSEYFSKTLWNDDNVIGCFVCFFMVFHKLILEKV